MATPLKALYRGASLETASRSPRRVIDALLAGLSTWALRDRADLIEVEAVAAVGGGRAVLLPAAMACRTPALERHLARAGIRMADTHVAHLHADSGEVVVPPLRLEVDWEPLEALLGDAERPSGETAPPSPGSYPLAARLPDGDRGPQEIAEAAVAALAA